MMDSAALFQFLRTWIVSVVGEEIEVIQGRDNGPAPQGMYIMLDAEGGWNKQGSPSFRSSDESLVKPIINDYQVEIQMWEVGGHGDASRACLESVDLQDQLDIFGNAGVSLLKATGPEPMPMMENSNWTDQTLTRLTLLVSRGDTGPTNYIETIEFNNQLGGT